MTPAPYIPRSNISINNHVSNQCISVVIMCMNVNGYVILLAIIYVFKPSNSKANIAAGRK